MRPIPSSRLIATACATFLAAIVAGCGGEDEAEPTATPRASDAAKLAPVKDYLLEHTERLDSETQELKAGAESYYEMAKAADFDYEALLRDKRSDVQAFVKQAQEQFTAANPAYEEMEGVVAGVPSLADYDVTIDAGSDGSDPESAVPFTLKTPEGKTYKQPGNFNYLIETSAFGTEPKFAAKGVKPDLDGDGTVEFGEAMPDASFYVTAARAFAEETGELKAAAQKWEPTTQDALTALVVMTPTMSEYFEAWKNSRFVAGEDASEKAFVAASRLQDITDILGGLQLIYDNVEPDIAKVDPEQASQTKAALKRLHDFAANVRDEEADGRTFTAREADTLGTDAQDQAEAIAGQISQAAGKMNIELET